MRMIKLTIKFLFSILVCTIIFSCASTDNTLSGRQRMNTYFFKKPLYDRFTHDSSDFFNTYSLYSGDYQVEFIIKHSSQTILNADGSDSIIPTRNDTAYYFINSKTNRVVIYHSFSDTARATDTTDVFHKQNGLAAVRDTALDPRIRNQKLRDTIIDGQHLSYLNCNSCGDTLSSKMYFSKIKAVGGMISVNPAVEKYFGMKFVRFDCIRADQSEGTSLRIETEPGLTEKEEKVMNAWIRRDRSK
jgi:hypothetical protein